jgi:hypothetical protein
MLKTDEWHFAHPSTWEDPYEIRIKNPLSDELFAQCWCRNGVSDAMWRIYSQDKLGVRIRVNLEAFRGQLIKIASQSNIGFRIARVKYVSELEYGIRTRKIFLDLQRRVTFARASAHLYLKRRAFNHEVETRIVVCDFDQLPQAKPSSLKIKLDARKLIDSVLVDPRAPDEYVEAYRKYLKDTLTFPGPVKKSQLYRSDETREA